jgi:hypothetical protein
VCSSGSEGDEAHSAFDVHPFGMMINGLVVGTCVWSTLTFGLGIYAARCITCPTSSIASSALTSWRRHPSLEAPSASTKE